MGSVAMCDGFAAGRFRISSGYLSGRNLQNLCQTACEGKSDILAVMPENQ
jgi:hypothetical protein